MLRRGGTYSLASRAAGVHPDTALAYRQSRPRFQRACDAAMAKADQGVQEAAHAMALSDPAMARWWLERRVSEYQPDRALAHIVINPTSLLPSGALEMDWKALMRPKEGQALPETTLDVVEDDPD